MSVEPNITFCVGQIRKDVDSGDLYKINEVRIHGLIKAEWLTGNPGFVENFRYDQCERDEIMGDTSIKDNNGNVILKDGTVMRIEDGTIMANTSTSSTRTPTKTPFVSHAFVSHAFVSHALDPVQRQKEVVDKLLKEKQTLDDIEKAVIEEKHILMEKLEIEQALLEQAKKMHKANERIKKENLSTECATSVDLIGNIE